MGRLLALLLLLPQLATAATYYVGTGWNACGGGTCQNTPTCGTTIGTSCADIVYFRFTRPGGLPQTGDTVYLSPGTYNGADGNCLKVGKNITWEGRDAAGNATTDPSLVTLDGVNVPNSGTCSGRMGDCVAGCDFTGFHMRAMTGTHFPNGGSNMWFQTAGCTGTGGKCSGLTIEYVTMTQNVGQFGFLIGDGGCGHGATCTRNTTNVTIDHFQSYDNLGDGLQFGAVDTYTVSNSIIHHNGEGFCRASSWDPVRCIGNDSCSTCACVGANGCDDVDGIAIGEAINGTIRDTQSYMNEQDGFDWCRFNTTDDCIAGNFNNVGDRLVAYDNGAAQYNYCACAHDNTLRNSVGFATFASHSGTPLNFYRGSCNINVLNNTFYNGGTASGFIVFGFSNHRGTKFINNIFDATRSGSSIFLMPSSWFQASGKVEQNNVFVNRDGGASSTGMECFIPGGGSCLADTQDSDYPCGSDTSICGTGENCRPGGGQPILQFKKYDDVTSGGTTGGLAQWTADWGLGSGTRVGTSPLYTQQLALPSPINATNLHLSTNDSVAKAHGQDLLATYAFNTDFDQQLRVPPWDIGFDFIGGAPVPTTTSTSTTSTSSTSSTSTTVSANRTISNIQ